ncbi:MAG: NAD(P)-dependent oxidoreductase [Firmicutes bacterium]|nr:NAD(P)-dependent oxidoreductase [Bacillota bacterium]
MRVLITGAAGGVGKYLIEKLTPGVEVVAYDVVEGAPTPGVKWVQGDILDLDNLVKSAQGCQAIIHLAAIPVYFPERNVDFGRINILGTQVVFEAAVRAKVKRVVYASSICADSFIFWSERRIPKYFPVDEDYCDMPDDMYGLSKLVNELTAKAYADRYGLELTGLRLATIWLPNHGPTDEWLGELFLEEMDNNLEYLDLRWQYVDVRDVVQAIYLSLQHKTELGIVNVGAADCPGGDWRVWVSDIYPDITEFRNIGKYLKDPSLPLWSIEKLSDHTGYKPEHSWKEYPVFVKGLESYLARRDKN